MNKFFEKVRAVFDYERDAEINMYTLKLISFFLGVLLFIPNLKNASNDFIPVFYGLTIVAIVLISLPMWIENIKNVRMAIYVPMMIVSGILTLSLFFGFLDGSANFWIFIISYVMIILYGLPVGIWVGLYFVAMSVILFWTPVNSILVYDYSLDYRNLFPVLNIFFFMIIFVCDVFYKSYQMNSYDQEMLLQREIKKAVRESERVMLNGITAITSIIDEKDEYTGQHSQRVAEYSRLIAEECGVTDYDQLEIIYRSGLLHDIGKIAVPDRILKKQSRLTDDEYAIMKMHTIWGKEILSELEFLPGADLGARYHHERFDGSGYPNGISGSDIPEIARYISGADALDAMNSSRVYRKKCDPEYILAEFEKNSGIQFDPMIAEAICKLIRIKKIEV